MGGDVRNYGDLLGKTEELVNCGFLENFLKEMGCRVSQGGDVPSVPPDQLVMITVFAPGTHSWCLLGVTDERLLSPGTSRAKPRFFISHSGLKAITLFA